MSKLRRIFHTGNWILFAALVGFMTFSYWTTAPTVEVITVPAAAPAPAARTGAAPPREDTQLEAPAAIQDVSSRSPVSERAHRLFDAGQVKPAIAMLTRELASQPKNAELAIDLGVLLLKSNRDAEAIARFEQAVRLAPGSDAAYYNLGTAQIKVDQIEAAIQSLQTAVTMNPHHSNAFYNLGVALSQKGDELGAMKAYRHTIEVDHGRTAALAHTNLGVLEKRRGQLHEALEQFEAALRAQPGFAKARFNKALTLSHLGRAKEAEVEYRKLLDVDPKHVGGRINLSTVLMRKKAWDKAITLLRSVIEDEPKKASAYYDLGLCYVHKRDNERAEEAFRNALDLRPDHAATAYNLGLALKRLGRLEDAAAQFRNAVRLVPDRAKYRYSLALALSKIGDVPGAMESYRAAIKLRPHYYAALYNTAMLEYESGDYTAARADFEKARAARPDSYEAAYNLGLCWIELKQPGRAEAVLREALGLESTVSAHYELGLALARQKRLDEAIASYKAALRVDPKHLQSLIRLAEIRAQQGDLPRAIATLKKARDAFPDDSDIARTLAKFKGQSQKNAGANPEQGTATP